MATTLIQKDEVAWTVPTIDGYVQAEVATGVNHRIDHILATNGFIAAALVGASAGALLAAIQEVHQASSKRNRADEVGHQNKSPDAEPKPQ
jgi:hypothetical protein